ncbi:nanos homolog 3-like [Diadema setosum]|uniref:nanos homolog 3-like n=1 Tax=Diadema setosum TaxID=31175 RepID=UPI003B3B96A4
MYHPFTDYFGLTELVSTVSKQAVSEDAPAHFLEFQQNGVDAPIGARDCNNNEIVSHHTGFLPLPIKLSDITELSKVMSARKNRGRVGTGLGGNRPPIVSWCVFCKNNGESEIVYGSHKLKSDDGRTTCPILRAYTCPLCGTNGDRAHTIKYCPLSKEQESGSSPTGPGTIGSIGSGGSSQYRTPRTSTGRRRSSSCIGSGSGGGGGGGYI